MGFRFNEIKTVMLMFGFINGSGFSLICALVLFVLPQTCSPPPNYVAGFGRSAGAGAWTLEVNGLEFFIAVHPDGLFVRPFDWCRREAY
jgi:hypothetical protein